MRPLSTMVSCLLTCCGLLAGALNAPPAAAVSPVRCAELDLPVSIPTSRESLHGQLCMPAGRTPTTVQLLLPGDTYNRVYWDFPYRPERYSYQRDMARHGFATFAVDRLGTGRSSVPPSTTLPVWVEAASIHQVVSHLLAGRVGGLHVDRVILVAHSLGSGVATVEAAMYHDVRGVILTGTTHLVSARAVADGFTLFLHPVTLDPQLRDKGGDPGYATTRPGQRGSHFYETGEADPRVIATDEATKDQTSYLNVGTGVVFGNVGPASRDIDVPVLLAVGDRDFAFCGLLSRDCSSAEVLRKQEAPFFSSAARLSTFVLHGSGHSIALHDNAEEYREATRIWLRAHNVVG